MESNAISRSNRSGSGGARVLSELGEDGVGLGDPLRRRERRGGDPVDGPLAEADQRGHLWVRIRADGTGGRVVCWSVRERRRAGQEPRGPVVSAFTPSNLFRPLEKEGQGTASCRRGAISVSLSNTRLVLDEREQRRAHHRDSRGEHRRQLVAQGLAPGGTGAVPRIR